MTHTCHNSTIKPRTYHDTSQNIYRNIMQPNCKLMLPKSLQNDTTILQNLPKMKQISRRDFGGMLARSKLAEGFFDTPLAPPRRLWAPLGEPFGPPLASFADFGKILAVVLETCPVCFGHFLHHVSQPRFRTDC